MDNHQKENVYKAHLFELPDKVVFRDKYHSYKDFQYEKTSVFQDEFLLQSSNEALVKEEHGLYDISRSDNETSGEDLVNETDESNATDNYEDE